MGCHARRTRDLILDGGGREPPTTMKEGKRMSTLKVPGAQLYYEVSGDGPLLILIPGAKGEGQ